MLEFGYDNTLVILHLFHVHMLACHRDISVELKKLVK